MALQRYREEEERVVHGVRLADDLLGQGLVRGEDAALLHRRHVLLRLEGVEAEGLVDGGAVPEPALERMDGARNVTLAAEEGGKRRDRIADVLLVRNAAIGQEGIRKAGQRFEFDIGGHAAELWREHVAGLHFADRRHRVGRKLDVRQTGRIPEGFAHQHDDVGLAAVGGAGRQRLDRDAVDRIGHVAGGRVDVGHRQVDRKGQRKAVVAIVFGLVPHDRDDLQAITDPGELVVIHDVPEGEEQRQRKS